MTQVSVAVEIDAPPERVWEVISAPKNLPHWQRHISRVIGAPRNGLRQGTTYAIELRFLAVRATVRARVLEWEPPRVQRCHAVRRHTEAERVRSWKL
jgi:uncharacterized protein YndB with AHSA1/START domain